MRRSQHKYQIEFSGYETLESLPVRLSEGDFKKHKCKYDKIVDSTKGEGEFEVEYRRYEHECDSYTRVMHFYTIGTSDIILTEYHCKENYYFTK